MNEYLLQQEAELEQENIELERRLNYAREYNLPKSLISNLEYKLKKSGLNLSDEEINALIEAIVKELNLW